MASELDILDSFLSDGVERDYSKESNLRGIVRNTPDEEAASVESEAIASESSLGRDSLASEIAKANHPVIRAALLEEQQRRGGMLQVAKAQPSDTSDDLFNSLMDAAKSPLQSEISRLRELNSGSSDETLTALAKQSLTSPVQQPLTKEQDLSERVAKHKKSYPNISTADATAAETFNQSLEQKLTESRSNEGRNFISNRIDPLADKAKAKRDNADLAMAREDYDWQQRANEMPSFVRGIAKGFIQGGALTGGSAAYFGDLFDSEDTRKVGMEIYDRGMRVVKAMTKAKELENINSLDDAATWLSENGGYVTYQAAESIISGGLGGIAGKTIGKEAIGTAATLAANNLRQTLGAVYGDAVEESKATGKPMPHMARIMAGAVVSASVDSVADMIGLKAVKGASGGFTGNLPSRMAKSIGYQVGVQGGTEAVQLIPEDIGAGKDPFRAGWQSRFLNEGAVGALGGAGPGIAGGLNRRQTEQPPTPTDILSSPDLNTALATATASVNAPINIPTAPQAPVALIDPELTALTQEAGQNDQSKLLADVVASLNPTGTLTVSGKNAAEAVRSLGEEIPFVKHADGSVLVSTRFAEPVSQAIQQAQVTTVQEEVPAFPAAVTSAIEPGSIRPQTIAGKSAETYTDEQLAEITQSVTTNIDTRKGAAIELQARSSENQSEQVLDMVPVVEQQKPAKTKKSGLQQRDDLVGAIMRVTGNKGIAANMAQDITGDTANRVTKLRGLFTNDGTADLGDTAMLLREQEGFDVRDAEHLSERIRDASDGNMTYSMERTERDAAANAEKEHKNYVNERAAELGLKKVGGKRTLAVVEADIARVEQERDDMEAREERAAIQAESAAFEAFVADDAPMSEDDFRKYFAQFASVEYTQEDIDRAIEYQTNRENDRAEAATGYAAEGETQGDSGQRNQDGETQEGARGTAEEGLTLTGETNEEAAANASRKIDPNALTKEEINAQSAGFGLQQQDGAPKPGPVQDGLRFSKAANKANRQFVTAPDGSINFGEITESQSSVMRRQPGKIRLTIGIQNADGTGHGLVHIEANHGKQIRNAGFGSVEEFVSHVASDFGQIWGVKGVQLLATVRDGKQHMMYIELEQTVDKDGEYYRVNSAFPVRQEDYPERHGFEKLWDGSEPTSAVTGEQPAFAGQSESNSGQTTPNARGQSDSNIQPDESIRKSFAGKSAATADTYLLANAQQRLKDGVDAETVRKETGWFIGADGKPRFEIDDSNAFLKAEGETFGDVLNDIKSDGPVTLSDLLDHPALFAAYPNLASLRVKMIPFSDRGRGLTAVYINNGNPMFGGTRIEVERTEDSTTALSALLHEIQHGIQTIEGFASGGTAASMKSDIDALNELNEISYADMDSFQQNMYKDLRKKYGKTKTEQDAYRRLAGEVEARNTQSRLNMTAEERRNASPESTQDVANSDVIIVFNGKEMASAPAPANAVGYVAPITEAQATTAITSKLGNAAKVLIDAGQIVMVRTEEGLANYANAATIEGDGKVQGATLPDGRIVLVLENLTKDNIGGVLEHEGFHSSIKQLLGEKTYQQLMTRLKQLSKLNKSWAAQAEKSIPADTKPENWLEEIGAYAIEIYNRGEQLPGSIRKWVEDFLSAIRSAIISSKHMPERAKLMAMKALKPQDLSRLVIAGLKAKANGIERGQMREAMAYSQIEQNALAAAWRNVSKRDGVFRFQISDSKDMEQVIKDVATGFETGETFSDFETEHSVKFWPKGHPEKSGWVTQYKQPRMVVLNVPNLDEGDNGAAMYAAVGNYAHNNNIPFHGDTFGVSKTAASRRLEFSISHALKYGSSETVKLSPMQKRDFGINWIEGNDNHNLSEMLNASYRQVKDAAPEIDSATMKDVYRITKKARDVGLPVGESTIRRAIITAQVNQRGVDAIAEFSDEDTKKILYSKTSDDNWFFQRGFEDRGGAMAFTHNGQRAGSNPDIRYSRAKPEQSGFIYGSEAREKVAVINRSLLGKAKVVVVGRSDPLPQEIESAAADAGVTRAGFGGVIYKNTAYIVEENIKSLEHLEQTIFHEIYGHYGIRSLFGKEMYSKLSELYLRIGSQTVLELAKKYGVNIDFYRKTIANQAATAPQERIDRAGGSPNFRQAIITEELLAHIAESETGTIQQKAKEVIGMLRQWLRAHGFASLAKYGETDLAYLLKMGRDAIVTGKTADGTMVAFSAAQPATPSAFNLPEWTRRDTVQQRVQDRYNRIRDVIKAVRNQGGNVNDLNDFSMGEDRFHGVAMERVNNIQDRLQSLLDEAKAKGITMEEVAMFAYAEHAPSRNAAMQAINPNVTTGSGMSDQEAADIIAAADKEGKKANLEALTAKMREIAKDTMARQVSSGLTPQSEADVYQAKYGDKWVPLRGFETIDAEGNTFRGTGKGFNIRGKENLRALGRDSKAGQILENILLDAERTAIRSTKNTEVNHRFLRFVMDNPDKNLWEVDAVKTNRSLRGDKVKEDLVIDKSDNTIGMKVQGEMVYVKIHDNHLFEQLANQWNDIEMNGIPYLQDFSRYLAKSYTAWSPEFALYTNPARDIQAALFSITGREGIGMAGKFAKAYPKALKMAYNSEVKGNDDPLYAEYKAQGGKTGFWNHNNLETKVKEIETLIKDMEATAGKNPFRYSLKMLKALEAIVSNHAGALENATRFASYIAMREAGRSREEAASFAKNLNVNFNRRGTWTAGIGSVVLFFNPAIQGIHNQYETLVHGKHKKQAWALMGVHMGAMAALALLNAAGGEDDDGVKWWDKIPDYEKERNMILVLPPYMKDLGIPIKDSTGRYLKIPMPYQWNIGAYAGTLMADTYRNSENPAEGTSLGKASMLLAKATATAYMPVSGAPPSVAPMLQHWGNKKPFGEGPLYPENQWNAHKPNSEKYSAKQKDTAWQEWASFVNSATGGDQFKEGRVSIPPAVWKNYVKTYLGGPMSFIEGIYDASAEEDITKAPFIRKAYGEVGLNADAGKFYQTTEKPIEAAKAYKDAAKSDPKYAKEMMQSEKVMIQLGELAMNYKEQLGKFTKDDIRIKDNVDYTDAEKRLKLKINEKRRSDYQEEYLAKQRQKLGDASVR